MQRNPSHGHLGRQSCHLDFLISPSVELLSTICTGDTLNKGNKRLLLEAVQSSEQLILQNIQAHELHDSGSIADRMAFRERATSRSPRYLLYGTDASTRASYHTFTFSRILSLQHSFSRRSASRLLVLAVSEQNGSA